jgi:hypothetical protein
MENPTSGFFGWLATQPPFIEVALGAMFCLIVAPTILATVAAALTSMERMVEARLSAIWRRRARPANLLDPAAVRKLAHRAALSVAQAAEVVTYRLPRLTLKRRPHKL